MGKYTLLITVQLIGIFLLFVNVILFFFKFNISSRVHKLITFYLLGLFILETACTTIGLIEFNSNIFLSHISFIFQFIFLSIIFYNLISDKLLKKIILINVPFVSIILFFQYLNNPALFWRFNLFEILIISFILIVYSLLHLFLEIGNERNYSLFITGLLLYLLCTIFVFLCGNLQLVFCEDPYIDLWIFNSVFYIVFQVFIFKEWKTIN